jgi:alanyl-tRNA synthetase
LKKLCADLKHKLSSFLVCLCANIDGKAFVAVAISENVCKIKQLDASNIIKEHIAPLIKGGGGGNATLATAGGQDISNLKEVLEKVKGLL